MRPQGFVERFADLTDPADNLIFNLPQDAARRIVQSGDVSRISSIDGHFALAAKQGRTVRLARTLGHPMRYFLGERFDGPHLIVAERVSQLRDYCLHNGMIEQFHPSYTRMVPAHYLVEVQLVGCPEPDPLYRRFFAPLRDTLPVDIRLAGVAYVRTVYETIFKMLRELPETEPVGVAFSGGVDSTMVLLLARKALQELEMDVTRLHGFTLSLEPSGADAAVAVNLLKKLDWNIRHTVIQQSPDVLDVEETIRIIEDYQPLDVQCAAMNLALVKGVRQRYPEVNIILDGDGGDENLKDYPLEGTDVNISSVLNNAMLYQEGWGVDSIRHSLNYSGGLSRSCTRSFMPARSVGMRSFSPLMLPSVIAAAEGIPFVDLTGWQLERLYALKGMLVAAGLEELTGCSVALTVKRRLKHGAACPASLEERIPNDKLRYREVFNRMWTLCSSPPSEERLARSDGAKERSGA